MASYPPSFFPDDERDVPSTTTDLELLKRVWKNEKAAPEILKFENSLIQRIKERIEKTELSVEKFEENQTDPLLLSLYQMDLHRIQFLLRSYLRVRLHKIEKYVFHIATEEVYRNRLSREEMEFMKSCETALENHLNENVLSKLPDNYQDRLRQSVASEENDMVDSPRLDTFVICKARQYVTNLDFEQEYRTEISEMERDLLTLACYKFVRKPFEEGKIDLI